MITKSVRRLTIGLGIALVVGSLTFATAGPVRAQAGNGQTGTMTQTVVPAAYGQTGGYGPMGGYGMTGGYGMMGHGSGRAMMRGAANGRSGPMGNWNGQASAQYHGGSHGGHVGGCW
uniref:Uncharacterized protein n=1 Tax=Desulfovibrio sp. U5L TaxID=596152 RepID=I2PWY7_9BACT